MTAQYVTNSLAPFAALEQLDPRIRPYLWPQKFICFALSLVPFGLCVRKCIKLEFLPTTEADFTALLPVYHYDKQLFSFFL